MNKIRIPIVKHESVFKLVPSLEIKQAKTWYQKVAFWLAKKVSVIAETSMSEFVEYKTTEVDLDDVQGAILQQQQNLMRIENRTAKYVLIGHNFIPKLKELQNLGYQNFTWHSGRSFVNPRTYEPEYMSRSEVFGLRIIFVPYMEGCLVLPDLDNNLL